MALLCGAHTPVALAGDLIITVRDSSGQPVTDAVVTVKRKNAPLPAIKPGSSQPHKIDQKDTAYHPAVSVIPVGAQVQFVNSDSWGHHVYSFSKAKKFDLTVAANRTSAPILFDTPGVAVIGCNIHDRMLAYIYVNGDGQPAKTDKSGSARFLGLPAGDYTVSAWHPMLRSKRKRPTIEVTVRTDGETGADIAVDLKRQGKKKRKKYRY